MKYQIQQTKAFRKTIPYFALLLFGLMLSAHPILAQNDTSSEGSDASAEEGESSPDEFVLKEIVATGSRLRSSGMETPTPVTVVTTEQFEVTSPTAMIEGLSKLPQFNGSQTTQNPAGGDGFFTSTGAGSLSLRGLQSKRTLQLLDGRRVVNSTIFGGVDINMFPEALVRSVETVTGGASAAYGTNAVAGVVNFLLDTDYEGSKLKVQGGQTEKGDNDNYKYAATGGFALSYETHLLVSAEKSHQDPIWGYDLRDYDWYDARTLMANPDTAGRGTTPDNPYFIPVSQWRSMNASLDGIFIFPASSGVGRYILDENGEVSPFVMGDTCNAHGCSTAGGGSGTDNIFEGRNSNMTPKSDRENFFGYLEHDVNGNLQVYGQALYGKTEWTTKNFGGVFPWSFVPALNRSFTIYSGNPFLPAEIQQIMDENGLDSVSFGRMGTAEDIASDAYLTQKTRTLSLTTGLEYKVNSSGFFDDWLINSYYQYGGSKVNAIQRGGIRLDRIYLATDVVLDDEGNPACNCTVTSGLYPDCVPLNLFGRGNASQEAIDWVTGFEPGVSMHADGFLSPTETLSHDYTSGVNKQRVINLEQHIFDIAADGEIYDGWGAGSVNMGVGYSYRRESFTQVVEAGPGGNINVDPSYRPVMANNEALGIRGVPAGAAASGNLVEIQFSNVPFARGEQDVHEAFDEILVPLTADKPLVRQLNFSGAVRWANYSGSGEIWSWKTGLDWSVNDEIRLRGTVSQDVRAATIAEKFDRTGGLATVTDYLEDPNGGADSTYPVIIYSNGSPDIKPEEARTHTVGVVYQPRWLDGFSLSLDWYSIEVTDNIQKLDAAEVVRACYQDGNEDYCSMITRSGVSPINSEIERITLVGVPFVNQASVKAAGVDFELDYRTDIRLLGGGETLDLRLLGIYLAERSATDKEGNKTEYKGAFLPNTMRVNDYPAPEWVATLSGNYQRGPFGLYMQARYTDDILINRNWNYHGTSTQWDVYDNVLDAEILVDARLNYVFKVAGGDLNLFTTINNLFDKAPQSYLTEETKAFFGTPPLSGHMVIFVGVAT